MMIPTGTDAPLYHPMWGTLGLLLANIAVFILIDIDGNSWWVLEHGTINPVQWVTSVFAHGDVFHLLGNMLFLVIFAGIIEGKVGWLRLLLIYGVIAIASNAFEQVIMLGNAHGSSVGASGVIYGLLVICMFWAPRNCIRGLFFVVIYPVAFNLPIWLMALFFIGWDFLIWILVDFALSTPMLHLIGAAAGILPGWYFLSRNLVDCEGWDGITIYRRWRAGLSNSAIALNQAYRQGCLETHPQAKIGAENSRPKVSSAEHPILSPPPPTQVIKQPGTATVHKNWMDDIGRQKSQR